MSGKTLYNDLLRHKKSASGVIRTRCGRIFREINRLLVYSVISFYFLSNKKIPQSFLGLRD